MNKRFNISRENKFNGKVKPTKPKVLWQVVIFSLIAIGFIVLSFLVNPYFIIGAIVFMLINQREIMRKKK
jgi:hypothetical protein